MSKPLRKETRKRKFRHLSKADGGPATVSHSLGRSPLAGGQAPESAPAGIWRHSGGKGPNWFSEETGLARLLLGSGLSRSQDENVPGQAPPPPPRPPFAATLASKGPAHTPTHGSPVVVAAVLKINQHEAVRGVGFTPSQEQNVPCGGGGKVG